MYVVVGLGNPDKEYEKTRHNVGFSVIDILAKEYGANVTKIKHKALTGECRIGNEKVLLVKPLTYMNLSGETLIDIYQYYKMDLENIIVIYDDIDLDTGKVRIRKKGSGGSHNGMKSIINCLGSGEFPRVRVGISKPPKGQDLANYVLSRFRKEEQEDIDKGFETAAKAVDCIIRENIDVSMNKYNKHE
ncbi:MAG: aminoacyl-tRNA hydrolase [Clostridioides sp.]|jgi:PTH1 family peptidyl-tRNA hydrolase|nr:aminoacyl-tRNA hydrolase [Clostridioides sp.]